MPAADILKVLARHPRILRNYRQVMLISHMRANTSLLGHLLGSSPEIEGYYELHMGYYSWKSFIRQKILYFSKHDPKPGARFFFDKVLHDDHDINLALFRDARVLFSLRSPDRTIPSIVSLYRKIDPAHLYATVAGATDYYVGRLASMRRLGANTPVDFLYLDADALRSDTLATLDKITSYLGLREKLAGHYDIRLLTGEKRSGDSSELIGLGKIESEQTSYSDVVVPETMRQLAMKEYRVTRSFFLQHGRCAESALVSQLSCQPEAAGNF